MKEATPPGASLTVSLVLVVIVKLLSSYVSSKQNGILYCPVSPNRSLVKIKRSVSTESKIYILFTVYQK